MKKKLGILIAVVMLVSLVFSTASMAAIEDKYSDIGSTTSLFTLDGDDTASVETKIKSDDTGKPVAMVADSESGANGQMAKFAISGTPASHYILFGNPSKDVTEYDGMVFRFKTEGALDFHGIAIDEAGTQYHPSVVRLVALDGTVTEQLSGHAKTAPAGFDGYIMFGFDACVFAGGKGNGTRAGDKIVNSDGTAEFDLTKYVSCSIVPTGSDTDKSFYIGNAMLYKLGGGEPLPDLSASKLDCKAVIADADNYSGNLVTNGAADSFWALQEESTTITASDGSINIAFGQGSATGQYIHSSLGKTPALNFSAGEALAFRVKTNAAVSIALRLDLTDTVKATVLNVKLLSLDGKFIEAETLEGEYMVVIPKNFDGYILYYLDEMQNDGDAKIFTRDGAFMVNEGTKASLTTVMQYVLFGRTADGNAFTGDEVLSIQGIYVVDVNASDNGGNGGGGNTGNLGAPLMIGTALAALASCAFVLKSNKKKA